MRNSWSKHYYLASLYNIHLCCLWYEQAKVYTCFREIEFNDIPSSQMARLDIDNDFCAASGTTPCTLQFNGDLSVAHLHVDRDLIMDKSGHTVFDVDIGALDSNRVSLTNSETLHGTYDFEDMTLGDSGFTGDIVYTYGGSSQSFYGYKVFFVIIILCPVIG